MNNDVAIFRNVTANILSVLKISYIHMGLILYVHFFVGFFHYFPCNIHYVATYLLYPKSNEPLVMF